MTGLNRSSGFADFQRLGPRVARQGSKDPFGVGRRWANPDCAKCPGFLNASNWKGDGVVGAFNDGRRFCDKSRFCDKKSPRGSSISYLLLLSTIPKMLVVSESCPIAS